MWALSLLSHIIPFTIYPRCNVICSVLSQISSKEHVFVKRRRIRIPYVMRRLAFVTHAECYIPLGHDNRPRNGRPQGEPSNIKKIARRAIKMLLLCILWVVSPMATDHEFLNTNCEPNF